MPKNKKRAAPPHSPGREQAKTKTRSETTSSYLQTKSKTCPRCAEGRPRGWAVARAYARQFNHAVGVPVPHKPIPEAAFATGIGKLYLCGDCCLDVIHSNIKSAAEEAQLTGIQSERFVFEAIATVRRLHSGVHDAAADTPTMYEIDDTKARAARAAAEAKAAPAPAPAARAAPDGDEPMPSAPPAAPVDVPVKPPLTGGDKSRPKTGTLTNAELGRRVRALDAALERENPLLKRTVERLALLNFDVLPAAHLWWERLRYSVYNMYAPYPHNNRYSERLKNFFAMVRLAASGRRALRSTRGAATRRGADGKGERVDNNDRCSFDCPADSTLDAHIKDSTPQAEDISSKGRLFGNAVRARLQLADGAPVHGCVKLDDMQFTPAVRFGRSGQVFGHVRVMPGCHDDGLVAEIEELWAAAVQASKTSPVERSFLEQLLGSITTHRPKVQLALEAAKAKETKRKSEYACACGGSADDDEPAAAPGAAAAASPEAAAPPEDAGDDEAYDDDDESDDEDDGEDMEPVNGESIDFTAPAAVVKKKVTAVLIKLYARVRFLEDALDDLDKLAADIRDQLGAQRGNERTRGARDAANDLRDALFRADLTRRTRTVLEALLVAGVHIRTLLIQSTDNVTVSVLVRVAVPASVSRADSLSFVNHVRDELQAVNVEAVSVHGDGAFAPLRKDLSAHPPTLRALVTTVVEERQAQDAADVAEASTAAEQQAAAEAVPPAPPQQPAAAEEAEQPRRARRAASQSVPTRDYLGLEVCVEGHYGCVEIWNVESGLAQVGMSGDIGVVTVPLADVRPAFGYETWDAFWADEDGAGSGGDDSEAEAGSSSDDDDSDGEDDGTKLQRKARARQSRVRCALIKRKLKVRIQHGMRELAQLQCDAVPRDAPPASPPVAGEVPTWAQLNEHCDLAAAERRGILGEHVTNVLDSIDNTWERGKKPALKIDERTSTRTMTASERGETLSYLGLGDDDDIPEAALVRANQLRRALDDCDNISVLREVDRDIAVQVRRLELLRDSNGKIDFSKRYYIAGEDAEGRWSCFIGCLDHLTKTLAGSLMPKKRQRTHDDALFNRDDMLRVARGESGTVAVRFPLIVAVLENLLEDHNTASRRVLYLDVAWLQALRDEGFEKEALGLELFGEAIMAFDMKGMSAGERRLARFHVSYMLRRVMGDDLERPTQKYRSHVGGIPFPTVEGMLSAFDAIEQLEERLILLHPRGATTNSVENYHSVVVRLFGMNALIGHVLAGAHKIDFAEEIRRNLDRGFAVDVTLKWQYAHQFITDADRAGLVDSLPAALALFNTPVEGERKRYFEEQVTRARRSQTATQRARTLVAKVKVEREGTTLAPAAPN